MHLPEAFRRMGQAAEVARFYSSWATACAAGIPTGLLPPALASTLQTAERTGETTGTLRHLADLYEAGVF